MVHPTPRNLHAGAWWLWALGLAAAASRTTNPVVLALIIASAAAVVAARRSPGPSGNSFRAALLFGLWVMLMRLVFQVLFGAPIGTHVLFRLPEVPLPDWAAGVRLGGAVTGEALVLALYQGFQLMAILACFGAANSLGDPRRLLRSMPGALYELGVSIVVALTFAPRLVEDLSRVRAARRLRGRAPSGIRDLGRIVTPVLEGSLDNALDLAAAMDSRGFGRSATVPANIRRLSASLLLLGAIGMTAAVFALLTASISGRISAVLLSLGVATAYVGVRLAGRRSSRTRYRPDPWQLPEWLVVACGLGCALTFSLSASRNPELMNILVVPLVVPGVPALALLGGVIAALPAWLAPELPQSKKPHNQTRPAAREVTA